MSAQSPTLAALDREIISAHASGDISRLARLYLEAAATIDRDGDKERSAFLHVQAYVLALDAGDEAAAAAAYGYLRRHGREE